MYRSVARSILTVAFACWCTSAIGSSLVVNQVDWLRGSGGFLAQNSEWGAAEFQFGPGDESQFFSDGMGGYYGYLQLLTNPNGGAGSNNWAVQNKIMVFTDTSAFYGRLPDTLTFNLGVPRGDDLSGNLSYRAYSFVTATPLSQMPVIDISPYQVAVGKAEWVFGGGAYAAPDEYFSYLGEAGRVEPATAVNYEGAAPTETEPKKFEAKIKVADDKIVKVKEELEGCGPGGGARSIQYLVEQGKISFQNKQTTQQIYDDLKAQMKTEVGPKAKGTFSKNFVDGKNSYAKAKGLKLMTEDRNCVPANVKQFLEDGDDVEIQFYFGVDNKGAGVGGHIGFVAEIIYFLDKQSKPTSYEVRVIDTPKQGSDTADNRSVWFKFDKDGKLISGANAGKGGFCNYFFREYVPE